MPSDADAVLLSVATAIADGSDRALESLRVQRPDLAPQLDRLKRVELIASGHRSVAAEIAVAATTVMISTDPQQASSQQTWGKLLILERLDGGGFGDVFRAFDPILQREVALKLLRPDRAGDDPTGERFLDEGRRLARITNPNVLAVFGADRHDGRPGLWTELLRGKTLEKWLEAHGRLNAREAALIGIDLCGALAAVHGAGLIHRDVKTQNVMREEGGRIVLMDFGTGWEVQPTSEITRDAGFSGTPLSMAPEQLRGRVAGPPTDIYGLGVLLYRLVTKRYPIEANTIPLLMEKHVRGESVPLRDRRADLPAAYIQIVEKALDPDPQRRFASAGAMEQSLNSLVGPGKPDQDPLPSPRLWERALWLVAPAIVLVALFAILSNIFKSPLTAVASIQRVRGYGEAEILMPGQRVSVGDVLFLSIRGSDRMSVYVINEDELGHAFILFPSPDLDLKNPLPANVEHRLPGTMKGNEVNWKVTSAGGEETYTVVAARKPLEQFEKEIKRFPHASMKEPIELPKGALRGTGEYAPLVAPPDTSAARSLLDALRKGLGSGTKALRDRWLWTIQLKNPPQ